MSREATLFWPQKLLDVIPFILIGDAVFGETLGYYVRHVVFTISGHGENKPVVPQNYAIVLNLKPSSWNNLLGDN